MAEAAQRDAWNHTALITCAIAEVNRDRKKRSRPFTPAEFNPFARKDKRRTFTVEDLTREILMVQESKLGGRG